MQLRASWWGGGCSDGRGNRTVLCRSFVKHGASKMLLRHLQLCMHAHALHEAVAFFAFFATDRAKEKAVSWLHGHRLNRLLVCDKILR